MPEFRRKRAQVRYSLWLAASMKFLVPFALLIAIGGRVGWRSPGREMTLERHLTSGRTPSDAAANRDQERERHQELHRGREPEGVPHLRTFPPELRHQQRYEQDDERRLLHVIGDERDHDRLSFLAMRRSV